MPIRQYLKRRFQDLMMFIERLLRLLILYFGQQNLVEITEQRAVEHDNREGKFQKKPIDKLGARAILFLSNKVQITPFPVNALCL